MVMITMKKKTRMKMTIMKKTIMKKMRMKKKMKTTPRPTQTAQQMIQILSLKT